MTEAERELMMAANQVLLSNKRQIEGERARLQAAVGALPGNVGPATRLLRDRAAAVLAGGGNLAELRQAVLAYAQTVTDAVRAETPFRPSRGFVATSVAVIAGIIED